MLAGHNLVTNLTQDLQLKPPEADLQAALERFKKLFGQYTMVSDAFHLSLIDKANQRILRDSLRQKLRTELTLIWSEVSKTEYYSENRGRQIHFSLDHRSPLRGVRKGEITATAKVFSSQFLALAEKGLPPIERITKEALDAMITACEAQQGVSQAAIEHQRDCSAKYHRMRRRYDTCLRSLRALFEEHFDDPPERQQERLIRYSFTVLERDPVPEEPEPPAEEPQKDPDEPQPQGPDNGPTIPRSRPPKSKSTKIESEPQDKPPLPPSGSTLDPTEEKAMATSLPVPEDLTVESFLPQGESHDRVWIQDTPDQAPIDS